MKIGKGLWLLVIVFGLFFCAGDVFTSNTEVFLGNRLRELFSEQKTIFIYGLVIWAARALRLGSNILLPRILDRLKDKLVLIAPFVMLLGFSTIGISGLMFHRVIFPIIAAGASYVIVKGILWDPFRTFLRMTAIDTNSKKRQQSMLVFLNAGQSVISIIMDLIVVSVLKIYSLEYVFLTFAGISTMIVVCSILLRWKLNHQIEIIRYETVLNEGEIDHISQMVYDYLQEAGMGHKEALSYRLLTEEKLLEYVRAGKKDEAICVNLVVKFDDFHVNLKVGEVEEDIFTLTGREGSISQQIFHNILGRL